MRVSLLMLPVALVLLGATAWSQAVPPKQPAPATTNNLPTVIKPKTAPSENPGPEAQPAADPAPVDPSAPNLEAQPDRTAPLESKENASSKEPGKKSDSVSRDATGASEATDSGPGYTGPAILSRGVNFVRPSLPSNERFRPYVGLFFYHDSGVRGPRLVPTGTTLNQSFTGLDLTYGLSGQHARRSDVFQLDYRGHTYVNGYSAQDHSLSFAYTRQLSRRLAFTLGETGSIYANNFAVLNGLNPTDTSVANTALGITPGTEGFGNRTYFSTTQGDLTYQKNARLSFNFGASGFYVKRNSRDLISANGYQARTDVAYRITRRTTLGPYYAYSRYNYSGTFGDSDIHTTGLNYSVGLTKRTQFRFRVGGTKLETRGLVTVVLDPFVARILGVTTGIERYYAVSYIPDFAASISRGFRRSDISLSYTKGVSPGNGVVLTSRRDSLSATYSYTGSRRYGYTLGFGRDALSGVSREIGNYSSYYSRVSFNRQIAHDVQGTFSFDYRNLGYINDTFGGNQYRISLGITYAPGFGPLKFWQ